MEELLKQKCVACERGAPKADDQLIQRFLQSKIAYLSRDINTRDSKIKM